MKRLLLLIICILPVCSRVLSQDAPTQAPVNPDFARFIHNAQSQVIQHTAADTFANGAMPPPVQLNFDEYFHKNKQKSGSLPAIYDMRPGTYLTPVKGQTNNACWAFATMAAVESQWLKLGLGTTDLSENNLKYCNGFVTARNEYGNHFMSTAYFARRQGPLTEDDDPNATSSSCPSDKIPLAYITDARYLPHDMDAIKQAIMDHGAIFSMMYFNTGSDYYNAGDYTYYYDGNAPVNHVVDLVGWDDNKVTAGGTGAWICRNSYGAVWGEQGYFYVSYYNKSFLDYNAYWPTRMDYEPEAQVYGYDELGNWSATKWSGRSGFMLVKFTASQHQLISKVATYAMAAGSTIGIDIYDHFDPATGVLSGQRTHQAGLPCELPGYYTFALDKPVAVTAGSDFYIRIYYQTPSYDYPIPIEEAFTNYSAPNIETGKAWIGYDSHGESNYWFAIGGSTDYPWDPCVKAYAEPLLSWAGTQSTDWNTAANWNPEAVPSPKQNVDIPATANPPLISNALTSPASCKALTISEGGSLTLAADAALTVYGDLTNYAGAAGLVTENGASLITMGAVNGQATIKQNISGSRWHLISPLVTGALAGTFYQQYLQQHNEATNAYSYITDINEALNPVQGYAFWGVAPVFTAQYSGYPNTGDQSMPLYRTAEGNSNGWNLVGNPYPSSIDWDATHGWRKDNVSGAIYLLNDGGWSTYLGGDTPVSVNGGSRFIAPGQGFFVNVTNPGSALLSMTDAVRVHNATPFLKNTLQASQLKFRVSGNGYTDEAVVRMMPEATTAYDASFDALKLFGSNPNSAQIFTDLSQPLAINSMPTGTSELLLCLRAASPGNYSLALTENSQNGQVVLEDTKTGTLTDLVHNPYLFTTAAGDAENRFRLHLGTLSASETPPTATDIHAWSHTVYISRKASTPCTIHIYTTAGQLAAIQATADAQTQLSLPRPGIYIVQVLTAGGVEVKKVKVE